MKHNSNERQTGRTTAQMVNAPKDALFIWPFEGSLIYPKQLARAIGRGDLKIVGPNSLDDYSLHGKHYTGVILDHAANFGGDRYYEYLRLLTLVRQ